MAVTAAKSRTVKMSGTSTAMTNEACTKVTSNTVYQITDSTKRVLDPAVALVVQVDADGVGAGAYVTASATTYTVDYLYGKITFLSDQGSSATVRISSGSYLPMVTIAKVSEVSLSLSREAPEQTSFDSAGYRERFGTLLDVSGSMSSFELEGYDHDPGAGTLKFIDLLTNGTPKLLESRGDSSGDYFRAWVMVNQLENPGAVADLNSLSVSFVGAAQLGTGRSDVAGFAWGT